MQAARRAISPKRHSRRDAVARELDEREPLGVGRLDDVAGEAHRAVATSTIASESSRIRACSSRLDPCTTKTWTQVSTIASATSVSLMFSAVSDHRCRCEAIIEPVTSATASAPSDAQPNRRAIGCIQSCAGAVLPALRDVDRNDREPHEELAAEEQRHREQVDPEHDVPAGQVHAGQSGKRGAAGAVSPEHDLRADEVGHQALVGLAADPDLPDLRAPPDVQRLADADQDVARAAGGEDVRLQLDRREARVRLERVHRAPGGDGVGERGPGAAVHVAAGVQVPRVHRHAPDGALARDLDQLDPQVAGEGARQHAHAQLGRDPLDSASRKPNRAAVPRILLESPVRHAPGPARQPQKEPLSHMAIAVPFEEKTDEQKAITEMVRQFADEQILPNAEHFDHEDEFPEPRSSSS